MFCRLFFTLLCLVCSQSLSVAILGATKPPQASGNDPSFEEQPARAPRKPSLQDVEGALVPSSTEAEPFPILLLPNDMLDLVFEFYCTKQKDDPQFVLSKNTPWREVCKRFRDAYDRNIFLVVEEVRLPSPRALKSFITPNSLGRRPIEHFSGEIRLYEGAIYNLLPQQQAAEPETVAETIPAKNTLALADVTEALQAHHKRGGNLYFLPHNITFGQTAPLADCLPVTSLDMQGEILVPIQTLGRFSQLTTLMLKRFPNIQNAHALGQLKNLRTLLLYKCENLTTLEGLSGCQNLEVLSVTHCSSLSSLGDVGQLPNLKSVRLEGLEALTNINVLSQCKRLADLSIACTPLKNIDILCKCNPLKALSLFCLTLQSIPLLNHPTQLESIHMTQCKGLGDTLTIGASNLQNLTISNNDDVQNIFFTKTDRRLNMLAISYCKQLQEICGLSHCKRLALSGCPKLAPTSLWLEVERLRLTDMELPLFDPVPQQQNLTRLDLWNTKGHNPEFLSKLPQLTSVKRLVLFKEPQNMPAIRSACKAQGIKISLWDAYYGPAPISLVEDLKAVEDPNEISALGQ